MLIGGSSIAEKRAEGGIPLGYYSCGGGGSSVTRRMIVSASVSLCDFSLAVGRFSQNRSIDLLGKFEPFQQREVDRQERIGRSMSILANDLHIIVSSLHSFCFG